MFRRLDRRERLVVTVGAAVSVIAIVVAWGVIPLSRRWSDREARISMRADQLSRLQGVLSQGEAARATLAELEQERLVLDRLLLTGPTPAVASSNLQLLLNRYAAESGLVLQRVDAVGGPGAEGPLLEIPARITAQGDIRELVDLLARLRDGETLLAVDDLRVGASSGLRGGSDILTVSVALHGYYRDGELQR